MPSNNAPIPHPSKMAEVSRARLARPCCLLIFRPGTVRTAETQAGERHERERNQQDQQVVDRAGAPKLAAHVAAKLTVGACRHHEKTGLLGVDHGKIRRDSTSEGLLPLLARPRYSAGVSARAVVPRVWPLSPGLYNVP